MDFLMLIKKKRNKLRVINPKPQN